MEKLMLRTLVASFKTYRSLKCTGIYQSCTHTLSDMNIEFTIFTTVTIVAVKLYYGSLELTIIFTPLTKSQQE